MARTRSGRVAVGAAGIWRVLRSALAAGVVAAGGASVHAQPSNDGCASPTTVSGTGSFAFSLAGATTSPEGLPLPCTPQGTPGIRDDVWFCWTATCTGLATFSTCGQTTADTIIAIYAGCGCPDASGLVQYRCCNDNNCNSEQSSVSCEVVCGEKYTIRIGRKNGPVAGASGTFTIDCAGQPCVPPVGQADCCNAKPVFASRPAPGGAGFPGRVAFYTLDRSSLTGPLSAVVRMFDIEPTSTNVPPVGCPEMNWLTGAYSDPSWSKDNLGNVFGVCLDDRGNAYVAHSAVYSNHGIPGATDLTGALAGPAFGAGAGAIYRLDSATGAASLFAKLDNNPIPGCAPPDPTQPRFSDCFAGLGNLSFDCAHAQIFVSNFMDGRIYRLSQSTGAVLSTFKHASGVVQAGGGSDPVDNAGFIPITPNPANGRGQRVWAVEPHGGRLYYSVWREDFLRVDPVRSNEVWSIGLTAGGDFAPGSEQLEVIPPNYISTGNVPTQFSSPVSDITFDPTGCMIVAQRTMASDTSTSAHQSKLLKFCRVGAAWVASPYGTFVTGNAVLVGYDGSNTAGGVDCDLAMNGRLWASADLVAYSPPIYGMQGFPIPGGTPCNSYLVDSDSTTIQLDKFDQGSLAVSCSKACSSIEDGRLLCALEPGGGVNYSFTLTNNSGVTAYYALLTAPIGSGVTFTPDIVALPPLASGSSTVVSTVIHGATPGQPLCFNVTLVDQRIQNCCTIQHCIDIPRCECAELRSQSIMCVGPGQYTYSFTLANFSGGPIQHVFLFPPAGASFSPDHFALGAPLPNFGTVSLTTTVTGVPGSQLCFHLSVHDAHLMECCAIDTCVALPSPCNSVVCALDINGDGVVDFIDLNFVLTQYGSSGPNLSGDINKDGVVNFLDLNMLLAHFGGAC